MMRRGTRTVGIERFDGPNQGTMDEGPTITPCHHGPGILIVCEGIRARVEEVLA